MELGVPVSCAVNNLYTIQRNVHSAVFWYISEYLLIYFFNIFFFSVMKLPFNIQNMLLLNCKTTGKNSSWTSGLYCCLPGGGNNERKAGVPSCSISGVIREEMASVLLQRIHGGKITLVLCWHSERCPERWHWKRGIAAAQKFNTFSTTHRWIFVHCLIWSNNLVFLINNSLFVVTQRKYM